MSTVLWKEEGSTDWFWVLLRVHAVLTEEGLSRDFPLALLQAQKLDHPKRVHANKGMPRAQHDGGSSHTFSGKAACLGVSPECLYVYACSRGTIRGN